MAAKLHSTGTSIFTEMSVLAQQYKAINLGQGFPDFDMDPRLIDLVYLSMRNGYNQYVHSAGLPALRTAIAEKIKWQHGIHVDPDAEITITPGASYAINIALATILQPGDEVIIFEPAYDCYIPAIEMNGGVPVKIKLEFPGFTYNWDEVRSAISNRTKAIIINNPHNPAGTVLDENDLQNLSEIIGNSDITLMADEVYEHIVFDGKTHLSALRYEPLRNNLFAVYSFGKTYHCTGWKIGYCIAPPHLTQAFRKLHQFHAFTTNSAPQFALAEYLQDRTALTSLAADFEARRNYLAAGLENTVLKPLPSSGTYFQLYSYHNFSSDDDKTFARRLTQDVGVTGIPLSPFYSDGTDHGIIRFCFAKKIDTLSQAIEKLQQLKA